LTVRDDAQPQHAADELADEVHVDPQPLADRDAVQSRRDRLRGEGAGHRQRDVRPVLLLEQGGQGGDAVVFERLPQAAHAT
jgi:hypothetical protein